MKIYKIVDGFTTNSSSASGVLIVAVRKGKDFEELLENIGIPSKYSKRFNNVAYDNDEIRAIIYNEKRRRILDNEQIRDWLDREYNIESGDLLDEYDILEAEVLLWANEDGLQQEGEQNPLRWFIDNHDRGFHQSQERENLVGDDLILLVCLCYD